MQGYFDRRFNFAAVCNLYANVYFFLVGQSLNVFLSYSSFTRLTRGGAAGRSVWKADWIRFWSKSQNLSGTHPCAVNLNLTRHNPSES